MPYVLWFAESGGKNSKISGKEGASMGELLNAGVPVPPGFIITSDACREFIRASKLGRKIQRSIKDVEIYDKEKLAKLSGEICEMLSTAEIPKEIERGIKAAFATLRGNDSEFTVSVKCSTEQDCGHECYASRGVSDADSIMKEALKCWESIYSPEAILQREENGLRHDDAGIAVVVQKLVLPDKCGTVMTIEGPENRNVLMVSARYGEGVKGPEDVYKVRKKDYTIIGKSVCDQRFMAVQVDGKTVHTNVREDLRAQQKISDKQIVELAKIGLLIEKQYGGPRMARWAIADGHLYITETAPVEECRGKPSELQEIDFEEHASIVIGPAGVIGATAITGVCVCACLLYTSPSPRDRTRSRMPSSA